MNKTVPTEVPIAAPTTLICPLAPCIACSAAATGSASRLPFDPFVPRAVLEIFASGARVYPGKKASLRPPWISALRPSIRRKVSFVLSQHDVVLGPVEQHQLLSLQRKRVLVKSRCLATIDIDEHQLNSR